MNLELAAPYIAIGALFVSVGWLLISPFIIYFQFKAGARKWAFGTIGLSIVPIGYLAGVVWLFFFSGPWGQVVCCGLFDGQSLFTYMA
ncbi:MULTISPECIES: hypothetical protein [Paraburkholderia]|uniref:hypothetical protein n=1 Tax=Paraburkholderia TaxID=1822464 RepID=UPI002252BC00|nr:MULTISPECIES: hypothetical protein [Paraburkholderia]MCX4165878.1 hypothetical protein [Paraburkholderia megapolitana]MDN7161369.1 hypothetical protein [Paraburkholderia sp. CHISQ3]MDQ6498416.1 hypothetical protein [Paraburkholderia megapolitana]